MKSKQMGRPVGNRYKVNAKQWKRWSNHARGVFNSVYTEMRYQVLFLHPEAIPVNAKHWKTVRHNAAWVAADAANK